MNYGFTEVLTLLGALGLFLYGMRVMSDALLELAGDRMRSILARTTANRFLAVLTGFSITAIIQSSSATTLMVVSFTNAGLLTLAEAIGVIMGANIGTTVTAWLISIVGFKLSMSAIALPLVGLGFIFTLREDRQWQHWGFFIIGFAVLFIGLQFLKESVPDVSGNPEALSALAAYTTMGFLSVLLFLALGALLTLMMQSSSAAMALTLLMTWEGWVPFDMAAAMVLGQNIGTTVTANLAALVANFQATRAARAHLIFNVLGVILALLVFYPSLEAVDWFMQYTEGASPLVQASAVPIALSVYHTAFNILNTLMLLAFIEKIAAIVCWMVPEVHEPEPEIDQPVYLSEASMAYPQTSIKALFDESLRLLQNAGYKAITHGLSVHRQDLDSDTRLRDVVKNSTPVAVDIGELYQTRIKSIYGEILNFATRLQSKHTLDEESVEAVRNILVADRQLVRTVKRMQPLHDNIVLFMTSGNTAIVSEYNRIRRRILKAMREIHRASESGNPLRHIRKLERLRKNASELDVLASGRVSELLLKGEISQVMATSLINDSEQASKIVHSLIDIATLLYYPKDRLVARLEEQRLPG